VGGWVSSTDSASSEPVIPHETGMWSASQGRWIPIDRRENEHPDFAIGRFDETGEIRPIGAGQGRVVDVPWSERELPGRPADPWSDPSTGPRNGGGSGPPYQRPATPGQDLVLRGRGPDPGRGADPGGGYGRGADPGRGYGAAGPGGGYGAAGPGGGYGAAGPGGGYGAAGPGGYRAAGTGAYAPQPYWTGQPYPPARDVAVRERADPVDAEPTEEAGEEAPRIGVLVALVSTLTWYVLAATLYVLGLTITNDGAPPADCAPDTPCVSPRTEALTQSLDVLPWVGIATVQAVVFALVLRWLGPGWRAIGLGFSAATVSAATTTALFTLLGSGF
jgi:hypothetical protein